MEKEILERGLTMNRRRFLSRLSLGIGSVALGSLLIPDLFSRKDDEAVITGLAQFAPKAKRIIYLFKTEHLHSSICLITNHSCKRCRVRTCLTVCDRAALNRHDIGSEKISFGGHCLPVQSIRAGKSIHQ
jgi:hypothetical protein